MHKWKFLDYLLILFDRELNIPWYFIWFIILLANKYDFYFFLLINNVKK